MTPAAPSFPFEPYRIKTVEPIRLTTRDERRLILDVVEHNLFRIPAEQVMIDLITDSGTGAMSSRQWAAMMRGDESYAGSSSYHRLAEACERIFGIGQVLPTHQGRAAERLLAEAVIGGAGSGQGHVVPNNAHFDTTRRMIEASGAQAINLLCSGGDDPHNTAPFKGNMDVAQLEHLLRERADDVPLVMLTLTCNSNGGQPVSLDNIRAVRELCDRFGKALVFDACRFAENAWLIRQREPNCASQPVAWIVRQMFDLADGAVMSARKDGLCNVGGLLLLRDGALFRRASQQCVMTDGFTMTYGSLPGRDLEAIAIGLHEAMDQAYLSGRVGAVARLSEQLREGGVPVVAPSGGHAVLIDAEAFCPHLSIDQGPAHALGCAIYEHAGIRCTRIGSVLKNRRAQPMELVRLAVPRRTYTQAHLDYVANSIVQLKTHARQILGVSAAMSVAIASVEPEFQAA